MNTQLACSPAKHHGATTGAVVGDSFYVIGGSRGPGEPLDTVHLVPLAGNSTRAILDPIPTPRGNLVAAAVGQHIYAVAGLLASPQSSDPISGPSAVVEMFDTESGKWSACSPLPAQRVKPGLAAVGDTLYALGGREADLDANTIFAYDTRKDAWTEVGKLPYAARHGAACTADGVIYYCGGWTAGQDGGGCQNVLIAFDPRSGEVRQLADMLAPRAAHSMVECQGALYVLGGVDEQKMPTSTVYRYNIDANVWEECAPLDSVRAVFACGVSGNKLILAGGWKRMGKEINPTEEWYETQA